MNLSKSQHYLYKDKFWVAYTVGVKRNFVDEIDCQTNKEHARRSVLRNRNYFVCVRRRREGLLGCVFESATVDRTDRGRSGWTECLILAKMDIVHHVLTSCNTALLSYSSVQGSDLRHLLINVKIEPNTCHQPNRYSGVGKGGAGGPRPPQMKKLGWPEYVAPNIKVVGRLAPPQLRIASYASAIVPFYPVESC